MNILAAAENWLVLLLATVLQVYRKDFLKFDLLQAALLEVMLKLQMER